MRQSHGGDVNRTLRYVMKQWYGTGMYQPMLESRNKAGVELEGPFHERAGWDGHGRHNCRRLSISPIE